MIVCLSIAANVLLILLCLTAAAFSGGLFYWAIDRAFGAVGAFWLVPVLVTSLFIFYVCFTLLFVLYYRLVVLLIPSSQLECSISRHSGKLDLLLLVQIFRIFVHGILIFVIQPITFVLPSILRLSGAKVGKHFVTTSGKIFNPELFEALDNVTVGVDAVITPHLAQGDLIIFKKIKLGNNSTVGVKAVLMPGVEVGDNSIVAAGAVVLKDTKIPPNEIWGGVPARKLKDI